MIDGGPAFPTEHVDTGYELRDYFAAAACTGLLSKEDETFQKIAWMSYQQADALLAERERTRPGEGAKG